MGLPAARILFHIPLLSIGGAEVNLLEIVQRLDRTEFEPVVWCSEGLGPIAVKMRQLGVPVHHSPLDLAGSAGASHCVRFIQDCRPAIFHSMSYRKNCSDLLAAVMADVPVLVTSRQNLRHWDPLRQVQEWEQIRNRLSDSVIANSQAVAALCAQVERLRSSKIRVIQNGVRIPSAIEPDQRLHRALNLPPETLIAGNVGNLKTVKGQDVLLRAWAKTVEHLPRTHLIICGADYGSQRELEALRKHLRLENSVTFLGCCEQIDLIYRNLDLYVQSSNSEALATTVLEAMSYGCPVVATDVGGTGEAVLHGKTGLLVPPGEPQAMSESLIHLLQDATLRRAYGSAGREAVKTHFEIDRVVREHEALYRHLLAAAELS